MKVEVCVETLEQAFLAQELGVDRIELCANLLQGGLTPSIAAIESAVQRLPLKVYVLIRPRAGHFCYNHLEMQQMLSNIRWCKKMGVDGVVVGVLQKDGCIDRIKTARLIAAARPMKVTFHRAFDRCVNPLEALDQLIDMGVDRLLTSGQKKSAFEGKDLIKTLVLRAKNRILIMPGAGVNASNIHELAHHTQANEFHFSVGKAKVSSAVYQHPSFDPESYLAPRFDRKKLVDCMMVLNEIPPH